MVMYRKRRWPAVVFGYAVFLAALGPITAFIYENSSPANQPVVIRLAVAFLLAIVLIHMRRYFRGDPLWDPPSDFEKALTFDPAPTKLHPHFAKLREEVANAIARRSFFESTLWPRLAALARARSGERTKIVPPFLSGRRGPSPRLLAELIDQIESRE